MYWILGGPLLWAERQWKSGAQWLFPGASITLPSWFWKRLSLHLRVGMSFLTAVTAVAWASSTQFAHGGVQLFLLFVVCCVASDLALGMLDHFRCVLWPERHMRYWFYETDEVNRLYGLKEIKFVASVNAPSDQRCVLYVRKHPFWGSRWTPLGDFHLRVLEEAGTIVLTDQQGDYLGPVPPLFIGGLHNHITNGPSTTITQVVCSLAHVIHFEAEARLKRKKSAEQG